MLTDKDFEQMEKFINAFRGVVKDNLPGMEKSGYDPQFYIMNLFLAAITEFLKTHKVSVDESLFTLATWNLFIQEIQVHVKNVSKELQKEREGATLQ